MSSLDGTGAGPENPNKLRWSDLENNEEVDLSFLLPPKEIIGPDKNGIKKTIEYKFNENGEKVRTTTTTRVRKYFVSQKALERRSWKKFGNAAHDDVAVGKLSRLTIVSAEEVFLQRPKQKGTTPQVTENQYENRGGGFLMICRICGKKGDHWTSKCLCQNAESLKKLSSITSTLSGSNPEASDDKKKNSAYIPPSIRNGANISSKTLESRHRYKEHTIKVDGISEDTTEADLVELFRVFGPLIRVFVATDRKTGLNKGFAFVSFVKKEDAQAAINKLDKYGYDNLILHLQWADVPRDKYKF